MNGVLLVDKPTGCTSHDVVRTARKILGTRKVGHAGTLDPLASGLLVLLVGQATKLSDYVLNGDKGYEADVLLGQETDSFDVTGNIVREKPVNLTEQDLRDAISEMDGELELPIPVFSAVKVGGKKLYEYARAGEEAPQLTRISSFYDVRLLETDADRCSVEMKCTKGAYIRSWVHTLGQKLGTGATVNGLRRTWSQPFELHNAISIEDLEMGEIDAGYLTMEDSLPHWPKIEIGGPDETLMLNGQVPNGIKGQILQSVTGSLGNTTDEAQRFCVISRSDRHLVALLSASLTSGLQVCRVFPRS